MPDYLDEKIVAARQAKERSKHKTLADGMYVGGELVEFKRVSLFGGRAGAVLPDTFIDLPKDMANLKYPYINRPQIIKSSLDTRVNYCFSYFPQQDVEKEEMLPLAENVGMLAKRANPSLQIIDTKGMDGTKFPTSYYSFKSFTLDGQLFNILFLISLYGKLLHGLFNCPYELREDWQPVALQMIAAVGDFGKDVVL